MPSPANGGADRAPATADDLFEALSDRQRRAALRYLRNHGRATVEQLADAIGSDPSANEPGVETASHAEVSERLREEHLSRLAEVGLVAYDSGDDAVRIAPDAEHLVEWFDLPPEWAPERPTDADGTPLEGSIRVLYVSDSASTDDVAATLAERNDRITVTTETAAEAALARIAREAVDCVVSDYVLSDTDGLVFLETVRERDSDLPFILFTDRGSEAVASEAFAAGATGYLRRSEEEGEHRYDALTDRIVEAVGRDVTAGYRQVFERIGDGALVYDRATGEILEVNRELCDLLGYGRADLLGTDIATLGVEDRAGTRPGPAPSDDAVWRVETSDGEERHLEAASDVVAFGDTECVAVTVWDVTAYRETEAALRESNRMFSTLVSNLPGMAYRCRNERGWPMEFVSEGCTALTGYAPDAVESGEVSWGEDVVHPDDRDEVWADVQAALDRREPFELAYRIVREDGEERWVWERGRGVYQEGDTRDDRPVALEGFVSDITERRERERRLEAVFDGTYQFTGLMEPDGTLLEANETALEFGGLDREEVVGEKFWETYWWQVDETTRTDLREAVARAAEGEFVRYEVDVQGVDEIRTIDFSIRPVTGEHGDVELLVPEGRDITERKRREEQLESLNEVAQELTEVDTVAEICDIAVGAAEETLDLALAAVERYDETTGALDSYARSTAVEELVGDQPLFDADTDGAWQAYLENEGTVYEDLRGHTDAPSTGTPLDSAIVLPLGKHGVFITGSTTPEAFADADVDLARILAAHTEAALDRVDRTQSLRERTETLERKNERLERVSRVNEVIRDLTGTLLEASDRAEIEQETCTTLANAGPYRFAWIGSRDPVSEELRPVASAGVGDGYLERVTVRVEDAAEDTDKEVAARAFHAREPRVVETDRTGPPFESWRRAALERDYRTAIAVPITYEGILYGVLALYGDDPEMFDSVEQAVIAELGETIGYAISAVERKAALTSDRVVELEFRVRDPDSELLRFVQRIGGEFELEGMVHEEDGSDRLFFSVRGGSLEEARSAAEEATGIDDVRYVSGDEEAVELEFTTVGEGMIAALFEHGAVLRELTPRDDQLRIEVELPASRDVREFAEMFETRFGDASLVARRERDRPILTPQGFREQLVESLTDRQREALKTAYFSGFFEWPRENTGQEVAETLDISQPTFNRHLRVGQQKLFEQLFDE